MSKNYFLLVSLLGVLVLSGCGASNTSDNSQGLLSNLTGPKMYVSDDFDALDDKDCEILSRDLIQAYTQGVPEEEIETSQIFGCSYTWAKSNQEEIELRNVERITSSFTGGPAFDPTSLESEDNTVALTFITFGLPQTEEKIDKYFRSSTNMLTEAEKEVERQAISDAFQSMEEDSITTNENATNSLLDIISAEEAKKVFNEVDGVGDRAAWSDFAKELVVQFNNFTFTLTVDLEEPFNNQDEAIKIGQQVVSNFKSML